MPLFSIENIAYDIRLGLWKIDECVEELFLLNPFLQEEKDYICNRYKSEHRRLEVLAVRLLLREMFGDEVKLHHYDDGSPYLSNGYHVSISHTKGFAVVIVSQLKSVAVDIETVSERVSRIAERFLRADETAETVICQLLHWCTKETLYKLYPTDKLLFDEMRLLSIDGDDGLGVIVAENLRRNESIKVLYRVFDNVVLTYTQR